ncbi:MAG: sensor histidine kinase, partial [Planctomycetaceae bacterium]
DFMKSEFVSVASHEIRTPLTSVKNALDLVLAGKTGAINRGQEKFLSLAKRNTDRLCTLVNHMFDIFQMESGKMALHPGQMDIADCIGNVIDTFKPLADEKSVSLEMLIDPGIPLTYADRHRINEVIGNLVGNAIRYTPENGAVTIKAYQIKTMPDMANEAAEAFDQRFPSMVSHFVEVTVTDNGSGIPDELVDHIFDKFRQVESSLSTEGNRAGMGLGLAVCKYAVEAHGGKIWCKSKKGEGSTFGFKLPISGDPS